MRPAGFLPAWSAIARVIIAATIAFSALGCMSSRYKMAPTTKAEPPVLLNLVKEESSVEATVQSVIIFQGPGSWKKEAYWDEYIVALANHGTSDVTVESATLAGLPPDPQLAGDKPWVLEKASRSGLAYNFGIAQNVVVQVGGGLGTVITAVVVGNMLAPGGWIISTGAAAGFVVGVPVAIGGTIYRNVSGRHKIEAEFERRRLALPRTLKPGDTVNGSLFFRITPGPRQLSLTCKVDGEPRTVAIDLERLGSLHLKAPATATASPEPKPPL